MTGTKDGLAQTAKAREALARDHAMFPEKYRAILIKARAVGTLDEGNGTLYRHDNAKPSEPSQEAALAWSASQHGQFPVTPSCANIIGQHDKAYEETAVLVK